MRRREELSEPRRARWPLAFGALALLGVGGFGVYTLLAGGAPGSVELRQELRDRGRVAVVGQDDLNRLEAEGAELLDSADVPGLDEALAGRDEAALAAVLHREGIGAVLVDGRRAGGGSSRGVEALGDDASLATRLLAYDRMRALQGVYLSPVAALYVRRRDLELEPPLGDVLARAARQLVGGAPTPRLRAFPEPLRRTRNVEVMVMLERDGRPRLWRSARGSSIARALITASSVARQRWSERQQAMGGAIDDPDRGLPSLAVKVYLLEEDGTLGETNPAFVERVFGPEHGVAFEDRGSWHYLLPRATRERGDGSAVRAYRELFDDAGMAADSLERAELRAYRLVARELGASAPTGSTAARAPAFDPEEIVDGDPLAPLGLEGL